MVHKWSDADAIHQRWVCTVSMTNRVFLLNDEFILLTNEIHYFELPHTENDLGLSVRLILIQQHKIITQIHLHVRLSMMEYHQITSPVLWIIQVTYILIMLWGKSILVIVSVKLIAFLLRNHRPGRLTKTENSSVLRNFQLKTKTKIPDYLGVHHIHVSSTANEQQPVSN